MGLLLAALLFAVGVVVLCRSLEIANVGMGAMFWHRLQAYKEVEKVEEVEEELKASFMQRVLAPLGGRVSKFVQARMPQGRLALVASRLEMAGRPAHLTPAGFISLRYVGLVVGVVGLGVLGVLMGPMLNLSAAVAGAAGAGLGGALGFFFPSLWLRQKIGNRKGEIARSLPDAMDLITTVVEAGMGFDGAIAEVAVRMKDVLGMEFAQVLRETKLGKSRALALEDLARRCGDDDIHNFVLAILQSEQMGTSVAKVLRIQSGELRRVRRQRAQQKAGAAPVKMLLPMVGCIFPVIWIVLMGPAVLTVLKSFGH
jgi:tight adherence protein C